MSKKFKVKIADIHYIETDQEDFEMLVEAAKEGDMQMIHESCDFSYKEECTVEKVEE